MGMAVDQFKGHVVDYVRQVKPALFRLDLGVEHHLKQHIPQFFPQKHRVLVINGLQGLQGFLQKS